MTDFFYSLIHTVKTRRWLVLLTLLEEQEHTIAVQLAEAVACSKRTIYADIKERKAYFDQTIALSGDDFGVHFSFKNPKHYLRKKQALIDDEPLFLVIDHLAKGNPQPNPVCAKELGLAPATFSRLKRQLAALLHTHYHLAIDATTNTFKGPETAIRQLLYDVYFTLPLFPQSLAQTITHLTTKSVTLQPTRWALDPLACTRWLNLVRWRIDQGHDLPEIQEGTMGYLQEALAKEWRQAVACDLPEREQATLFLLTLDEEHFFNSLAQKEFIRSFSPQVNTVYTVRTFEGLAGQLFLTLIDLLATFFQLSQAILRQARQEKQAPKELLLVAFDASLCTRMRATGAYAFFDL